MLLGDSATHTLSEEAIERLVRHDYPGNVRELRNIVRRAAAIAKQSVIGKAEIDRAMTLGRPPQSESAGTDSDLCLSLPLREARRHWVADHTARYLSRLLDQYQGDLDAVAAHAQVHRKSVQRLQRGDANKS